MQYGSPAYRTQVAAMARMPNPTGAGGALGALLGIAAGEGVLKLIQLVQDKPAQPAQPGGILPDAQPEVTPVETARRYPPDRIIGIMLRLLGGTLGAAIGARAGEEAGAAAGAALGTVLPEVALFALERSQPTTVPGRLAAYWVPPVFGAYVGAAVAGAAQAPPVIQAQAPMITVTA